MAYIGAQPKLGNFQACDAITTSATATFNLLVGGVAIFPQSAQHCLVSLNGVLQAPISSYTISGSTIIFASALTTDDSIDFITILGDTLDLGVPSDDTVGAAQIKADLISGTTALTAEPADTDEFLVSDAGVLKRIDYSLIKASPAMEKIATVTAGGSSNAVSFDGHFSTTYDKYKIYIQNWRGNDNSHITMRYRIGNSEKSSSHYASIQNGLYMHSNGSKAANNNGVWNGSAMRITPNGADDSANYFQHCVIDLINPLGTGYKTCTFESSLNAYDQTLFIHGIGGGHYYGDTGALSGLSFYISAGTITATIKIYGIKT